MAAQRYAGPAVVVMPDGPEVAVTASLVLRYDQRRSDNRTPIQSEGGLTELLHAAALRLTGAVSHRLRRQAACWASVYVPRT